MCVHAATAVKLEEEFNKLRAQLEKALASFRLSGMGDCAAEEVEENSYKVYSSKFADFCDGRPVVLYAYELLVREDGMLFSFSTQMPTDCSHTSESRRSVCELSESEAAKKHSKKRTSDGEFSTRMLEMFAQPLNVNVGRSRVDSSLVKKRELQAKAAQVDYDEKLLKQLVTLSEMIDTYEHKGAASAPMLDVLRRKKANVEASLAMSCEVSEDGGAPGPSSAAVHPNAGSSDIDEDTD